MKKRKDKPTRKMIIAMAGIMQGKSARQSMIDAGYSQSSADHPSATLFGRAGLQTLLNTLDNQSQAMFKQTLSKKLAKTLLSNLQAYKIYGTSDDYVEIPDFTERRVTVETIAKIAKITTHESSDNNILNVINEQKKKYGF